MFQTVLSSIFNFSVTLLTSFYYPGTLVTPLAFLLFGTFAVLSLKWIFSILGSF